MSFSYDIWGNLREQTVTKGDDVPMLNAGDGTTKNQITGFCYDAAGNLLAQSAPPCPAPTYVYDAENRLISTAGVSYTYDGDGRRMMKSEPGGGPYDKLYWYGAGSEVLVETDLAGDNPTEFVFFGGSRVARRDPSGSVYYFFSDHLGSSRVVTNATGTIVEESDFYPGVYPERSRRSGEYRFTHSTPPLARGLAQGRPGTSGTPSRGWTT